MNQRIHAAQASTHVARYVHATIDWLESVAETPDADLPKQWGTAPGMTGPIWSANVAALRLAQRRNRPVLLIPILMNEFSTARRLLLEPVGLSPFEFSNTKFGLWIDHVKEIACELCESPLHLWHPEPEEFASAWEFQQGLKRACTEAGTFTVIVDSAGDVPGLRTPADWQQLSADFDIELIL